MDFASLENLNRYSDAVIAAIAEHYETGKISNPKENHTLMSMLALVCEGKVVGYVPKNEPLSPRWRITGVEDDLFD